MQPCPLYALPLFAALISCQSVGTPAPVDAATPNVGDASTDRTMVQRDGGCAVNSVELVLSFLDDEVDSQLVRATGGGRAGFLALDTGSEHTFMYGPTSTDRRPLSIGCETFSVITRDFDEEVFEGTPIIGVLGADFFASATSELDYPGRRLVRYHAGTAPADLVGYASAPYELISGHIGLRPRIDDAVTLLMFDTGATEVLLVPSPARAGDQETRFQDVEGNTFPAFVGETRLALGDDPVRTAGVQRVPSWPYFQSYQRDIHPDLSGLLGRVAMGFRRIVFDRDRLNLRLGPITAPMR